MVQDSPSRNLDKVIVRLPDGMRDRLKAAAAENKRSLNAEIIARLEASFTLAPKLEKVALQDDVLRRKILEMQADLSSFMLLQGQDPAAVRQAWKDAAAKIAAEKDKPKD